MHRRLLSEPLVHFCIGAVFVFIYFMTFGQQGDEAARQIQVTEQDVQKLIANWQGSRQRPPSAQEIDGLIRAHVRDEVLVREALRLGLDREDSVVRGRMLQKMRFLQDESVREPTEEELQHRFAQDAVRYAEPSRYSFTQVFLDPAADLAAIQAKLEKLSEAGRVQLETELEGSLATAALVGVPARVKEANAQQVARQFGEKFASQIGDLAVGRWSGPIFSGYGAHLVLLEHISAGEAGSLDDPSILKRVRNDWIADQKQRSREESYQRIRAQYQVKVATP